MTTTQYLTKEGLEKLKNELERLETTERQKISNDLEEALAMGDLRENAAYHDAKDRQAWQEGRICEIKEIIRNAVLIEESSKKKKSSVELGTTITVKWERKNKDFKIVGSNEADPLNGLISNESPLGRAFLGKKVNEEVEVEVPRGIIKYKIIKIK